MAGDRGQRARKVGLVTSDRMEKTVVVSVTRLVKHPVYKRYVRKTSKFMAHDDSGACRVGDTVELVETRPMSARKRWRVGRVISQGVRIAAAGKSASKASEA